MESDIHERLKGHMDQDLLESRHQLLCHAEERNMDAYWKLYSITVEIAYV